MIEFLCVAMIALLSMYSVIKILVEVGWFVINILKRKGPMIALRGTMEGADKKKW